MKRDAVVTCFAELISQKPEIASLVVDVIALIDIETQVSVIVNKTFFFDYSLAVSIKVHSGTDKTLAPPLLL